MTGIITGQAPAVAGTKRDYFNYVSFGYLGSNYAYCYDVWNYHYTAISRANLVIAAVNNAGDADDASATYAGFMANAAKYARLAINEGYQPITKQEWYNNNTGLNTADDAWIWAMHMGTNDIESSTWTRKSFTSYISSETEFGTAGIPAHNGYREIDKQLFSQINEADWRRAIWVAPEDEGKADSVTKYTTLLTASNFANLPAYAGLKFKPAGGNMADYKAGSAVDMPLMRVKEMYFIEAEATAFT